MLNFYSNILHKSQEPHSKASNTRFKRYSVYKNCGSIESVNIQSVLVNIQVGLCILLLQSSSNNK